MSTLAFIGASTSAGAHSIGLENGPEHYRRAGLVARMLSAGLEVIDLGDTAANSYVADQAQPKHRNLQNVVRAIRDIAQKVDLALCRGVRPLIVGGDCTVTLGLVLEAGRHWERLGLLYMDAQADLNTPETSRSGILDSMGLAHMVGLGAEELTRMGARYPLINQERIAVFGYDPTKIYPGEEKVLREGQFLAYPISAIAGRITAKAAEARRCLEERASTFVVHFDVDVVSFVDFPVADVPLYHGQPPSLDDVLSALEVFVRSPQFGGLSITELNPDLDPDGRHVKRLLDRLVPMLAGAREAWMPLSVGNSRS